MARVPDENQFATTRRSSTARSAKGADRGRRHEFRLAAVRQWRGTRSGWVAGERGDTVVEATRRASGAGKRLEEAASPALRALGRTAHAEPPLLPAFGYELASGSRPSTGVRGGRRPGREQQAFGLFGDRLATAALLCSPGCFFPLPFRALRFVFHLVPPRAEAGSRVNVGGGHDMEDATSMLVLSHDRRG